jgi:hypothetical protein
MLIVISQVRAADYAKETSEQDVLSATEKLAAVDCTPEKTNTASQSLVASMTPLSSMGNGTFSSAQCI